VGGAGGRVACGRIKGGKGVPGAAPLSYLGAPRPNTKGLFGVACAVRTVRSSRQSLTRKRLRECTRRLAGAEEAVARVAEARHDVALLIEGAIQSGAVDGDVRVAAGESTHALGRGDETEKPNTRGAGALE